MAVKKITDLQLIEAIVDDLSVPGDDGIQTYRLTAAQLKAYVLAAGNVLSAALNDQIVHALSLVSAETDDELFIGDASNSFNKKRALISDLFPRERIILEDGNGSGSTATKIRRFSNIRSNNGGSAMTLTQSSANGDSITINQAGIYTTHWTDYSTTTTPFFGVSVDASSLTTNFGSLTYAQGRRCGANTAAVSVASMISYTDYFPVNTVLRAHHEGNLNGTTQVMWTVMKVSR